MEKHKNLKKSKHSPSHCIMHLQDKNAEKLAQVANMEKEKLEKERRKHERKLKKREQMKEEIENRKSKQY